MSEAIQIAFIGTETERVLNGQVSFAPVVCCRAMKRMEYGARFESEAAYSSGWSAEVLVTFGISLILTTAFGSARDALIVMHNLPLAVVGEVLRVCASVGVLPWPRSSASSRCSA